MKLQILPLGELQANCYILSDDDGTAAVIDPGAESPALADALRGLRLRYILLTHGHFDHVMGVPFVKRLTGAPVLIHHLDAPMLYDEKISMADRLFPGRQNYFYPDIYIGDGDTIDFAGGIHVYHTPGHSMGSVCYRLDDTIFTGDTLFCRTVGRTDLYGGSMAAMIRSVDRLQALPGDYILYPGHSRSTTMQEERTHNRYFRKRNAFFKNQS
ncbi:MAG: MBL fold metallo-hydrolase [Clostridia bacterium]|nr:MBL fold metallo-hydrolase [Clostridia bacterium]